LAGLIYIYIQLTADPDKFINQFSSSENEDTYTAIGTSAINVSKMGSGSAFGSLDLPDIPTLGVGTLGRDNPFLPF